MCPSKRSYGIICCRKHNTEGTQILMVKKSVTYHFCEFVVGKYNIKNKAHLMRLFNNMTYYEKMDILSMDFKTMWYRVYREHYEDVVFNKHSNIYALHYFNKKSIFEKTFLIDNGELLRKLISNSVNVETQWEFPKGRKNNFRENDIMTAIREFKEETNVLDSQYTIQWNIKPYTESYIDFGVKYINKYYFAYTDDIWEPVYNFCNHHI